jgi:hypothetical protein
MKHNCAFFFFSNYRLPDGNVCLEVRFSDTHCVIFICSFCEFHSFTLALALGYFKLSLEECIKFTIFGLKTNVVHELFSFHHLENFGQSLRQHLQQQKNRIK